MKFYFPNYLIFLKRFGNCSCLLHCSKLPGLFLAYALYIFQYAFLFSLTYVHLLLRTMYMNCSKFYIYCSVHHNILWNNQQMQLYAVNFIFIFRSHYGPGVDSASNRNEYQENFLGVNAAGAYGWQTFHLPVPLSWNLGTLTSWNPLGHSRPVTGLIYLYFYMFIVPCIIIFYEITNRCSYMQ